MDIVIISAKTMRTGPDTNKAVVLLEENIDSMIPSETYKIAQEIIRKYRDFLFSPEKAFFDKFIIFFIGCPSIKLKSPCFCNLKNAVIALSLPIIK